MPRPRSAAFLVLAWAASVQSCGWESTLSAAGSLTPDTLITVRSELEQKTILIRGKAADFGACPPLAEDAIYAPIRKAQYAEQYDDMEYGAGDFYPVDACVDVQPSPGEILWTVRGGCNFVNKTLTAHRAKAVAVLVANAGSRMQSETELTTMGCPTSAEVRCDNSLVPTVFISARDSRRLAELQKMEEQKGGGALQAALSGIPAAEIFWEWLSLGLLSALLILGGALISPALEQRAASTGAPALPGWETPLSLSVVHAGAFVVASSISMMMCLFFLRDFLMVFISVYALAAACSLAVVLSTALRALSPRFARPVTPPLWEPTSVSTVALLPPSLLLAAYWFLFRHAPLSWLIQDVLSGALAAHVAISLRFRDLRVASILTALAVIYDLCWVLVAPAVYSHAPVSILVLAGAPPPPPPTAFMDRVLQLHPADTVPLVLLLPSPPQVGSDEEAGAQSQRAEVLLGLGTVVLPALLLALARRADLNRRAAGRVGASYVWVSGGGCGAALWLCGSAAASLHRPVPFLLFLSLATLGPFIGLAWSLSLPPFSCLLPLCTRRSSRSARARG